MANIPDSIAANYTTIILLFFVVFAVIFMVFIVINIILLKQMVKTQLIVVGILQEISQSRNFTRKIDHKATAHSTVTRSIGYPGVTHISRY